MPEPHLHSAPSVVHTHFNHAMQGFAPWEDAPHLAVAVSGGADSMALALLAQRWVQDRGGTATALLIDHGLRPESADEVAVTRQRLESFQIEVVTQKLALDAHTATHETARIARYGALEGWCRSQGVLHLLLGHHGDDQAETLLLRLISGSTPKGLSGMAACREVQGLRHLRPLLGVAKSELQSVLRASGTGWAEDPSNHHPRYARTHARALLASLPPEQGQRLRDCAQRFGRWRQQHGADLNHYLAQHAILWPQGVGWLASDALDHPLVEDAVAAMLRTIAGAEHPPRTASIQRALSALRAEETLTLHGCMLEPFTYQGRSGTLIYREYQAVRSLRVAARARWWDRFRMDACENAYTYQITALGPDGFQQLKSAGKIAPLPAHLPYRVCLALPALWHLEDCLDAPHITTRKPCAENAQQIRFHPLNPLGIAPFSAMNESQKQSRSATARPLHSSVSLRGA